MKRRFKGILKIIKLRGNFHFLNNKIKKALNNLSNRNKVNLIHTNTCLMIHPNIQEFTLTGVTLPKTFSLIKYLTKFSLKEK